MDGWNGENAEDSELLFFFLSELREFNQVSHLFAFFFFFERGKNLYSCFHVVNALTIMHLQIIPFIFA